jgi:major capsid protein E
VELYDEYVTPAELTGYSRAALEDRPENALILSRWFPYNGVNDLSYRFTSGGGDLLLEAADFRAYDAEPSFGRRHGIARVTGDLPPIARQYVLDEFSNLTARRANNQEFRDLFLRDGSRIAREVDIRMEFARAEALVSGTVTLNERGVQAQVNFGRKASHVVAPAVLWSNHAGSTPLDDMQAWRDVIVDDGGNAPGAQLMSTVVINDLLRSDQVRGQVFPLATNAPQVTMTQLGQVLQDFDLPPIVRYNAKGRRGGHLQRYIPDDKVVMLPESGQSLGATVYGTTLESQMAEYGIGDGDLPGLVVAAFIQRETPVRVITIGSAIALPVLGAPDDTLVADVR